MVAKGSLIDQGLTVDLQNAPPQGTSIRRHLAKAGDAILKGAQYDPMTGAKKDRAQRRAQRAQRKRLGQLYRAKQKQLGKFGAASPVRIIPPDGC